MNFTRVKSVKPLNDFFVHLKFTDDASREVNLEAYLHGKVFEPIRESREKFRTVKVDERAGTIVWENGADIDPDVLYHGLKPAWAEKDESVLQDA